MDKDQSAIESRVQREKDAWNKNEIFSSQKSFKQRISGAFENPHTWKMEAQRDETIRDKCKNAAVLDLGCFEGDESKKYLDYGASYVCGIDVSDEAISRAKKSILDERAEFMVADAHNLPFESNSFDLIVGRAILHHLMLKEAYSEIFRILKPGGSAMFVEPLRGNPLAKIVRLITPNARTEDELPLDQKDIGLGNELIGKGSHGYSGFISSPVGAAVSLCGGKNDNWLMKLASVGDDMVVKTPLKYWGRLVFLNFKKL